MAVYCPLGPCESYKHSPTWTWLLNSLSLPSPSSSLSFPILTDFPRARSSLILFFSPIDSQTNSSTERFTRNMTFKSLMIFALVASVGHVLAAPLARNPCQGAFAIQLSPTRAISTDIQKQGSGVDPPIFLEGSPSLIIPTSPFQAALQGHPLLSIPLLALLRPPQSIT